MIEGYINQGDTVKAKELITQMKTKDIRHRPRNRQWMNTKMEEDFRVFDNIVSVGIRPSVINRTS